jgi:hypothetical protein
MEHLKNLGVGALAILAVYILFFVATHFFKAVLISVLVLVILACIYASGYFLRDGIRLSKKYKNEDDLF